MTATRRTPSQILMKKSEFPHASLIEKHANNSIEIDHSLVDVRITQYDPLIPPNQLSNSLALSDAARATIKRTRAEVQNILDGKDDRVLVIVGPCSIHDVDAALEYARFLVDLKQDLQKELCIVMRAYFEKPRTTIGWKGLLYDPFLDGSCQINIGLGIGRKLLCDIVSMGMPVGVELLDTISPQYLGDLISWGAIGARTTESQVCFMFD